MKNKYNMEQNQITKESIFSALMSLMANKDFKNISITEVTQKAGVSRMAFYRNYSIMEDVLIAHLDEMYRGYGDLLAQEEFSNDQAAKLFFFHFRQHKVFINNLLRSRLAHLFLDQTVEFLVIFNKALICTADCSPEFRKYNIDYIAGGLFNVLVTWCKGGMSESDEQMAEFISERLSDHITGISWTNVF